MKTIRIDKLLAQSGVISRRKVEKFLKKNDVRINKKKIQAPGKRVSLSAEIKINGKKLMPEKNEYYILNKPEGVISTARDEQGRQDAVSLIPSKKRLYPVGRLDKETTGLILLTNDGELAYKMTHPKFEFPKTYKITARGKIPFQKTKTLENPMEIQGETTAPAKVKKAYIKQGNTVINLTIREGKNRQIRRMCGGLGIEILKLKRVALGPIEIGSLKTGKYRKLTEKEVKKLKNYFKDSS